MKKTIPSGSGSNTTSKRFYTTKESQNAFLQVCATEADYKEKYNSRVSGEKCIAPYISLIGNLNEPEYFMIDFENISYKIMNFARALDVSFKAYYVFNIAYPEACAEMWDFINKKFYNIPDSSNKTKPGTLTLLKEIKSKSILLLILDLIHLFIMINCEFQMLRRQMI